jgi:uncharacterized protein
MYQWDVTANSIDGKVVSTDSHGLKLNGDSVGWSTLTMITFPTLTSVRMQIEGAQRQLDLEFESRAALMAFASAVSASGARSVANFDEAYGLLRLSHSASAVSDDLLRAAGAGDIAWMSELLDDAGADVNIVDVDGDGALYYAASRGHVGSVALLLKRGANPNLVGTGNALSAAAMAGSREIVDLLLASGAEPEVRIRTGGRPGFTALMLAAGAGQNEVVRTLVASGADLDAVDDDGDSVLLYAVSRGRLKTVELLLALGASASPPPGGNNHTPLTVAVMQAFPNGVVRDAVTFVGATDMIRLLLGHGSDPTPVYRAGFKFFLGDAIRPHFVAQMDLQRASEMDGLGIWYGPTS